MAPAAVYATLLDEGVYLCSESTMYRLLRHRGETGDRRRHSTHPAKVKTELVAQGPGKVPGCGFRVHLSWSAAVRGRAWCLWRGAGGPWRCWWPRSGGAG